jgi:hypothetical protein
MLGRNTGVSTSGLELISNFKPHCQAAQPIEPGGVGLERYTTIEIRVLGLIHLLHPASADLLDNPVVTNHAVERESNMRSGYVV